MCGLAGVILKKKDRTDNELSLITKGFTRMLKKADMRGGHATGFAVIDRFGGYILMKRPRAIRGDIVRDNYETNK